MAYNVHIGFDVSPADATLFIALYDLLMNQKPDETDALSSGTLESYFTLLDSLLDALPDIVEDTERYTGFDRDEFARVEHHLQEQIQRSRERLDV